MPLPSKWKFTPATAALMLAVWLLWPATAHPALVYKNYIVQQDSGMDILCAPYTVQPGDWVIKILRLRGEIAAQDFPYFLQIFARINPQVKDVDRIRTGQQIFIPLRQMPSGTFPAHQSGLVTIPFVDLSQRNVASRETAPAYRVRAGDSISKLVANRYGRYGSAAYQEGVQHLKALNPQIKDLDLIFVDQVIFLPGPEAPSVSAQVLSTEPVSLRPLPQTPDTGGGTDLEQRTAADIPFVSEAAAIMGADLLDSGTQVFSAGTGGAVRIDLSKTPVIDMPDGRKVMLGDEKPMADADLTAVKAHWKHFRQLSLPANASLEQVLEAVLDTAEKDAPRKKSVQLQTGGVTFTIRPKWLLDGPDSEMNLIRHICITPIATTDQRTPSGIVRFLAGHGIRIREVVRGGATDGGALVNPPLPAKAPTITIAAEGHRQTVVDLLEAMNYPFTQNVTISFPYAGIEVNALSNLVTTRSGNPLFIDFGDLYGDAFSAITNTGFNIIQVTAQDDVPTIIDKILTAVDEPLIKHPGFLAANRPEPFNTRITIPGHLMGDGGSGGRTLITSAPIAEPVLNLLSDQHVRVVIVRIPGSQTAVPIPRQYPTAS